jgi:hypothetical protein
MRWFELWSLDLQGVGLIVQVLTLVVLYCTLIKLREYTNETKRLAIVAVEEMSRPCVLVKQHPDSTDEAIIKGHAGSITGSQTLSFRNMGTALAINVRYKVQTMFDRFDEAEGLPLAPGEVFVSSWPRQSLVDPAKVVIEFESLGGGKYGTETVIEDRCWVKSQKYYRAS